MSQRRQRRHAKRPLSEINVVPYIDVMLVLLIIFMITAPLLTEGVNVDLPQAQAKALDNEDEIPVIVSVDGNGHYYLNIAEHADRPIASADLIARLSDEVISANRTVLVKGDANVAYGKVMDAMVLLQQAGVDNVGLMTQPPDL